MFHHLFNETYPLRSTRRKARDGDGVACDIGRVQPGGEAVRGIGRCDDESVHAGIAPVVAAAGCAGGAFGGCNDGCDDLRGHVRIHQRLGDDEAEA